MRLRATVLFPCLLLPVVGGCASAPEHAADPLPSWRDATARDAIIDFVERTTDPNDPDFLPESDRVAVFDNDGTLWAEQPIYFQFDFAIERAKEAVDQDPGLAIREPFQTAVDGEAIDFLESGHAGLVELLLATHSGTNTTEFQKAAETWIRDARHPDTGRPYPAMVYQPMIELLDYLERNGFSNWIVSGGGTDFMRVFAEGTYGIPPERVIGSEIELEHRSAPGGGELVRTPVLANLNDGPQKVIGIHRAIGRRPVAAFGNSDGDLAMLEWTAGGGGPTLCVYLHHTDEVREWSYDRGSRIGRLDRGLDAAKARSWPVIDMKRDWEVVFPGGD
ncbi:MAG: haloacid dehalogenase-like hydrolase [Phycisphaera sp.]|nr:haloacid dehalogenase-like hydrolase [Phycisphaera sp.]